MLLLSRLARLVQYFAFYNIHYHLYDLEPLTYTKYILKNIEYVKPQACSYSRFDCVFCCCVSFNKIQRLYFCFFISWLTKLTEKKKKMKDFIHTSTVILDHVSAIFRMVFIFNCTISVKPFEIYELLYFLS